MGVHLLHGVNLAGWLMREAWISPSAFVNTQTLSESSLRETLGDTTYYQQLDRHRAEFVSRDDFVALAARGFNAVRIVVPWTIFSEPHLQDDEVAPLPAFEHLDKAFMWADELGLKVVLALGADPSLILTSERERQTSLQIQLFDAMRRICERYALRMSFYAFELLDASRYQRGHLSGVQRHLALHCLRNFYRRAYECIRQTAGAELIIIVPLVGKTRAWQGFMAHAQYEQVWFSYTVDAPLAHAHIQSLASVRNLTRAQEHEHKRLERLGKPVMVSSWSASLPLSERPLTPEGRLALERIYASDQLRLYSTATAWFFTTWKTEALLPGYDARLALARFERSMMGSSWHDS